MAYLGRQLDAGTYLKLDDISSGFNGSTKNFSLTSGGTAFYPGSSYSILVSLANVIQEAETAYTIDQDVIKFTTAPANGAAFFCIVLGVALGVGVPGHDTVGLPQLKDSAKGVGIHSSGNVVGSGVTQLNFIGLGNTFLYNASTKTVDISISGNSGAGGTWAANATGIHTTKIVGVNTTTIAGAATSEGALQSVGNISITDGMLITDSDIATSLNIPSGKNGLLIGTVTVGAGVTIDVAQNSTLVVV